MKSLKTGLVAMLLLLGGSVMQTAASGIVFSLDEVTFAEPGDRITVSINVANNPGFTIATLLLRFDQSVMSIAGVTAASQEMPLSQHFTLSQTGEQWIPIMNPTFADWLGIGAVLYVTFQIRPDAPPGMSAVSLGFTTAPPGTPANAGAQILHDAVTVSGVVHVLAHDLAGDSDVDVSPGDLGGFIGVPYEYDDEGIESLGVSEFGEVPQTGVAGPAGMIALMLVSLGGSAAIWAWLFDCKRKSRKNEKPFTGQT